MDHHHTTTGHESTSQSLPSETRLHHVKGNLMHLTHIVKAEPREHNKNIPKSSENDPSAEGLAKDLANDRAFEAYHESELSPSNTSNKVGSKVNAIAKVAKAIANPRNVTKRSAAKTLANRDSPFITLKEDESLVKAVDSLEHAESEERDGRTCNEEVKRLSDELNQLETRREQTRVSWTMSRYVHRARVIPAETCERPIFPTSATGSSKPAIGARISWLGHVREWAICQSCIFIDGYSIYYGFPAILPNSTLILTITSPTRLLISLQSWKTLNEFLWHLKPGKNGCLI